MRKVTALRVASGLLVVAACTDGGSGTKEPLFQPNPECDGASIAAFQGMYPQAISTLAIGDAADGFDLNRDGKPDNKLAAVTSLANSAVEDALSRYEIVIPLEFFDLQAAAPDPCVKFAVYLGDYLVDKDADDQKAYLGNGDCNDNIAAIKRDVAEVAGNRIDDDCDGLADEDGAGAPSVDTADMDGDGMSMAQGDCDDTNDKIARGKVEICHDGLDNDCDGVADRSQDEMGVATACSPFDGKQDIHVDPLSFATGTTNPLVTFHDGVIADAGGKLQLTAGPSLFSVSIPVTDDLVLDLRITGAMIEADVVTKDGKIILENGRLGGVLDARTADTIRGLEVDDIMLKKEDSLLDATFGNLLAPLLALPKAKAPIGTKYPNCRTPDIDVDQDGLEAFCDSNLDDDLKTVDVCVDGDGTEVLDIVGADGKVEMQCSEAEKAGKSRFVDGISVALKFGTSSVKSIARPR